VQPVAVPISAKKHCLKHNKVLCKTKLNAFVASVTEYNGNSKPQQVATRNVESRW